MSNEVNLDQDLRDVEMRIRLANAIDGINLRFKNCEPDKPQIKTRRDLRLFLLNDDARKYRGVGKMALRELYEISGMALPQHNARQVVCPQCECLFGIHK